MSSSGGQVVMLDNEDVNESLICAVREGRLERARELINSFGLSYSQAWSEGYVLLCDALKYENAAVAKLLLTSGSKVNNKNEKSCNTPLHFAVINGDIEIVKMILDRGANINAQNQYGRTPLHNAIETGRKEVLKLLLQHGADVNTVYNSTYEEGFTPLHSAAKYKQAEVAKLLISYKADINAQDKIGKTPIFYAIANGDLKMTKVLLECGAKVDSKMESDITPLHFGAQKGYQEIIETILKFGANIDSRDAYGRTALHIASQEGHVEVVDTLLEYGSDINITCGNNLTPLERARAGETSYGCFGYVYYDYDYDTRSYEVITEALRRHIVKMKTANLYLSEKNLLSISRSGKISDFQDECEEEIARMKSEKINNSNISFYDILAKGTSSLAIYMRNENIVEVLKSNDYKTKFPIYASMIESHFRKGMERKELLEQSNKIFHLLFNNFPELPYVCIEKIFSYLSNEDLKNFDGCL